MRRGVFLKLLVAFLLVIGAATFTLDVTIRRAWEQSLQQEIERALVEKTQLFAQRVQSDHTRALAALIREEASAGNVRATVIDNNGRVLADSQADAETMENHASRPEFISALHGQTGIATRSSHTLGIPFLYVAAPVAGGAVRMAYPLSTVKETKGKVRRSLLIGSAIALLAALVLAAAIAQLVARRLRRIVLFAERIAAGDLSARIAESSADEIATVAAALDRTARKLEYSFAAIETSRRQLEALLNSMQEAVIAVGGDARVIWANGRMERLVGSVHIGAPVVETVRDPSFLAAIEGAIGRGETCNTRVTALLPGRVFQVTAAPMPLYPATSSLPSAYPAVASHNRNLSGASAVIGKPESVGAVAVLHDLTNLERVEKTRRDFIANVSHELRTPLTSVQGYAETLLDSQASEDANTREFLEIILKNAARMSRLTEDLLVLARVESGEQQFTLRRSFPAELLQDAFDSFVAPARVEGVALAIENATVSPVLADPEAIHQVLANLIRNAINYARDGGRIVLGTRPTENAVEFYVRDFGPGIASEHLPRLFERFYRVDKARSREAGGTGLGLAIVKHIVLAHGGQVRAESHLGHGATFYFTLPTAPIISEADATAPRRVPSLNT